MICIFSLWGKTNPFSQLASALFIVKASLVFTIGFVYRPSMFRHPDTSGNSQDAAQSHGKALKARRSFPRLPLGLTLRQTVVAMRLHWRELVALSWLTLVVYTAVSFCVFMAGNGLNRPRCHRIFTIDPRPWPAVFARGFIRIPAAGVLWSVGLSADVIGGTPWRAPLF